MFLLDLSVKLPTALPGVAPNAINLLNSQTEEQPPKAIDTAAANLSEMVLSQGQLTLQYLEGGRGKTLIELSRGTQEEKDFVKSFAVPDFKGASSYAGSIEMNKKTGAVTKVTKNDAEETAAVLIKDKELAALKKDKKEGPRFKALEARMKADKLLGLFYYSVFSAKDANKLKAAVSHLNGAVNQLAAIRKAVGKGPIDPTVLAYLASNATLIKSFTNKITLSDGANKELNKIIELIEGANAKGKIDKIVKESVDKAVAAADNILKPNAGQKGQGLAGKQAANQQPAIAG